MPRRLLVAALVATSAILLTAVPASAHAVLLATTPSDGAHLDTPPSIVTMTFSEHVSAPLGAVRVFDAAGKRVDNGNVVASDATVTLGLDGTLADGCYIVTWRVISADSHPVHGAFNFVVGASTDTCASPPPDPSDRQYEIAGAVARFVAYTGTLLAAGGALFLTVVHDRGGDRYRLRRVVTGAALGGGVGVLATLPIQAALATGLGLTAITKTGVLGEVAADGVGLSAVLALAGLAVLTVGLRVANRPAALLGAAAASVSFAFAGHTTATDPRWLSMSADIVHAAAGAAWFGGLVLLTSTLRGRRSNDDDAIAAGSVVARFTTMATICVLAVTITGTALGWTEVRALRALTSTTYGQLLIAKAALAGVIALIGAYNHYRLVPALQRAAEKGHDVWHHLMRTVRVEAVGMVIVLGLTAILVNVTPARNAAGIGTIYSKTETLGAGSVNLVVDPNRAGTNAIHLYLLDPSGRPAALAEAVTLELSLPSNQLGPIRREPFVAGPGHYQLNSSDLSIPGKWSIVVRAQVSKFEEQAATFEVTVSP
ncbi:MAG: copper transport protein [Acidimicrobiaceae bacterium]